MCIRLLKAFTVSSPFLSPKPFPDQAILVSKRTFVMTTPLSKEPRNFAPLKEGGEGGGKSEAPKLKGVVFDVDGTLW